MEHRTTVLQKVFAYLMFTLMVALLVMLLAMPVMSYHYGPGNNLTALVEQLIKSVFFGLLSMAGVSVVLRWIGYFPRRESSTAQAAWTPSWRWFFPALVFWIVVGLALVVAFNLLPGLFHDSREMDVIVNVLPMVLLIGTWIAFLIGMTWTRRDKSKGTTEDHPTTDAR